MKRHEVTKCSIGSIGIYQCWKVDLIDLFHVTVHIKSNASLISLYVQRLSSLLLLSSQHFSLHSKEKSSLRSPRLQSWICVVLQVCDIIRTPGASCSVLTDPHSAEAQYCSSSCVVTTPPATLIHSWSLARFWIYYFRGRTISGPGCQHAFSRHHGQKSVQLQFYFTLKIKQRLGRQSQNYNMMLFYTQDSFYIGLPLVTLASYSTKLAFNIIK